MPPGRLDEYSPGAGQRLNEDKDFQGLHAVHLHQAIHTFEIPEVFSLPVGQGDVQYLKWIEDGMEED